MPMAVQDEVHPGAINFGAALRALAQPWREIHLWPPLSWLAPRPQVRVLHADGSESLWKGDQEADTTAASAIKAARHVAVELPEALRLDCRMKLPAMQSTQLYEAVALQVLSASPFEPSDLVWGFQTRPGAGKTLEAIAVLASRRSIERHLQSVAARLGAGVEPEVWAFDGAGSAIVIQGYGEAVRHRASARGSWAAYTLLALALALGTAAALTPTLKLKLRAAQAVNANQELERKMAPLITQREQFVRTQADLEALRQLAGEHVEALAVVELVTQLVPDDTWLQRLQVQGSRVSIAGQTPNTAALMNTLSGHPGVRDVKAPAAATRSMEAGRENFNVEWTLSPELLRPSVGAVHAGAKP